MEYFINRTTEYTFPVVIKKIFSKWREFIILDKILESKNENNIA